MRALNRYALSLAVFALVVILSGALITSTEVVARQTQSLVASGITDTPHRVLSLVLALLTLALATWSQFVKTPAWIRAIAWLSVAVLIIDALLGWSTPPLSPGIGVIHAILAHLFFALLAVIAAGTSANWNRPPEHVDGASKPLLRPLALATPPVVFLQVTLGAAYRHNMTSIMPHMAIAMAVAFMALIGSSVILQNFPGPKSLRQAAIALITLVLIQVSLGIGAFLMLVLNVSTNVYFIPLTVGHVAVGSATLAASVVMAMKVWRSVLPKR
jgi:heme A synthase